MQLFTLFIWFSYLLSLFFVTYWAILFIEHWPKMKKDNNKKIVFTQYPFVSIVVPAYNEEATIYKTIDSLCKLDWPHDKLEIIVIDDGSKDNTSNLVTTYIRKHPSMPVVLIRQENQGKAVALNNGLAKAKGKYFACLDADSFVHKDALRHIIFWHEQDPDLAIATPVMKVARPTTWVQRFQRWEYMAGMLLARLMGYVDSNYVAPGPFSVYKTALAKEVGGFDTQSLVEDQEIAYKMQMAHYRIRQIPHAFVDTVGPASIKGLLNQRNRWQKGTLMNLIKYRKAIFNRSYGDFGMFQMPLNVATFLLSFIALFAFFWLAVRPFGKMLRHWWIVRFDFLPYLKSFTFSFNPLNIQIAPLVILWTLLIIGIAWLFISAWINKDSVKRHGVIQIIPYFLFFYLIIAYVSIRVIIELALGKKQKW